MTLVLIGGLAFFGFNPQNKGLLNNFQVYHMYTIYFFHDSILPFGILMQGPDFFICFNIHTDHPQIRKMIHNPIRLGWNALDFSN